MYQAQVAVSLKDENQFKFLLDAVASIFPPILFQSGQNHSVYSELVYQRFLNVYRFQQGYVHTAAAKGVVLCKTPKLYVYNLSRMSVTFNCTKGQYISPMRLCAEQKDCPSDTGNEKAWACHDSVDSLTEEKYMCKKMRTAKKEMKCGELYHTAPDGNCLKYDRELFGKSSQNIQRDNKLKESHRNESPPEFVDLPIYTKEQIRISHKIQCKPGCTTHFNIHDICTFRLDSTGRLEPCQTGGHL